MPTREPNGRRPTPPPQGKRLGRILEKTIDPEFTPDARHRKFLTLGVKTGSISLFQIEKYLNLPFEARTRYAKLALRTDDPAGVLVRIIEDPQAIRNILKERAKKKRQQNRARLEPVIKLLKEKQIPIEEAKFLTAQVGRGFNTLEDIKRFTAHDPATRLKYFRLIMLLPEEQRTTALKDLGLSNHKVLAGVIDRDIRSDKTKAVQNIEQAGQIATENIRRSRTKKPKVWKADRKSLPLSLRFYKSLTAERDFFETKLGEPHDDHPKTIRTRTQMRSRLELLKTEIKRRKDKKNKPPGTSLLTRQLWGGD